MPRHIAQITVVAAIVLLAAGPATGTAMAATTADPVNPVFTTPSLTIEYGQSWYLEASAPDASIVEGEFTGAGTLTGAPSGYTPLVGAYRLNGETVNAYMVQASAARPLPVGSYSATLSLVGIGDPPPTYTTPTPAQLTITPAALGIALTVTADPSNPANAIIAARFTGPFADGFFSTIDPMSPLSPAGTWTIRVRGADGEVAYEFSDDRTAESDMLGVSTYWSDVPPGEYTARATFVPSGDSTHNFTIADPAAVTYTAAAAPGSGSTAPPAPPAPPETEQSGMTLPLWVPIAAGVLTAGLLALMIVQIVRLRRAGRPATSTEVTA